MRERLRQSKRDRRTGHLRGMDGMHLRPWEEVTAIWNQISGQDITRARVIQVCQGAERKLRKLLEVA